VRSSTQTGFSPRRVLYRVTTYFSTTRPPWWLALVLAGVFAAAAIAIALLDDQLAFPVALGILAAYTALLGFAARGSDPP
jgi:hypothetical protein